MANQTFKSFYQYLARLDNKPAAAMDPTPEEQAGNYEAGLALIDGQPWRIRTARITPTKPGAFVALWHRGEDGLTQPFTSDESIAGLLVFVQEAEQFGVFRFSPDQLREFGITSSSSRPGKRGFRVYPPWSTGLNKQALRTQQAQGLAFVKM